MDRGVMKVPGLVLVVLFGLGVLWGRASITDATTCIITNPVQGEIILIQKRGPSMTQYRVHTASNCTLLVTTGSFPEYHVRDVVEVAGEVQALDTFDEEFAGYADYLNRHGVDATVSFATLTLQTAGDVPVSERVEAFIRRHLTQALVEPEASVVSAMVIGDRGMVPGAVTELLEQTGISHILAISGLHITIVAGVLLAVAALLPIPSLPRAVLVIFVLWMYVALVSFPISAQRAALFWTLTLLAFEMRVLVSLPTVFLLTTALLVSVHPSIIREVGFQLSFAAVVGIGLVLFLVRSARRHHAIYQALAVPVGAAATTWPIISVYFGIVSPITVLVNFLAVPTVPLMMILSLLAAAVGIILPLAGTLIGLGVHGLWLWLLAVASLSARIPGATFTYTAPAWLVGAWYATLISVCIHIIRHQKRSWREIWE